LITIVYGKIMAAPQIPLGQIITAMDRKDRDFYDNLSEELKKKFSPFIMLKYSASLGPPNNFNRHLPLPTPDMMNYYLQATNYHANKHMFDLAKHPKLQWLMLTTVSPAMGDQSHVWIKGKPKPKNVNAPIKKQLLELFPFMKEDDVDVLSTLTTKKELRQYVKDHGES